VLSTSRKSIKGCLWRETEEDDVGEKVHFIGGERRILWKGRGIVTWVGRSTLC
jgi:hypothetical protein